MCENYSYRFDETRKGSKIEVEVIKREEAEADPRFEALKGYFVDVERRVALHWEARNDEPCSLETAPIDEIIPDITHVHAIISRNSIYRFE